MPLDVEAVADAVLLIVKTAIAPMLERLAVLESKATDAAHTADLAVLRADLVILETRLTEQKIPGPPGPPGPAGADGKDGLNGKDGAAGLRYKGVYEPGDGYEPGDVVTWRGSAWHCDGTTTAAPDTGRPWQLVVKAGRDGRDRRVEAAH